MHDFFDAVHLNRNNLFVDFSEWLEFLGKLSEKTNQDFSFIASEKGMFSFLGLSVEQAQGLRKDPGIYMLDSSRINVAALNDRNMDIVVEAVASVL